MIPSPLTARNAGLAAWLRVLVIALLVALALPAVAMADDAAGGTATATHEEQTTGAATTGEASATTDGAAPPAAEEPQAPPAGETAPPASDPAPADEPAPPPAAEEPQAPPAADSPASPQPSGPAPAPSGDGTTTIDLPVPVIDLPAIELPVPTIPEILPPELTAPGGETLAPVPVVGEVVPVLAAPRPPVLDVSPVEPPKGAAPLLPGVAAVNAQAADVVTRVTLGGPPTLLAPVAPAALGGAEDASRLAVATPLRGSLISLVPPRNVDPVGPVAGAGAATPAPDALSAGATAEIAPPQLVSPAGPAPAQSLLAVLASYILPGSGPVPAGMMVVLVMLGVLLAAAFAPRPAGSERIWLSGLLGPRCGHGLAVRRPG